MITIGIILLLVFIFTGIGSILWVNYDYNNTLKEIERDHAERIVNIIETGLDRIKDIYEGEEWTTPFFFRNFYNQFIGNNKSYISI